MTYFTPRQIDNQWRESPWEVRERQRKQRMKDRAVKGPLCPICGLNHFAECVSSGKTTLGTLGETAEQTKAENP